MEKHFYSLNDYLQNTFGTKVYKLSIDLGLTCPNRDGSLDTRGCIFCLAGSSHFAACEGSISERIERAKALVGKKTKAKRFIAYFQSYTNTYAPVSLLEGIFTEAILRDDIVALSIATRPDCLPDDVLDLLGRLNQIKPVWVELGLQTANEQTAEYIRRCYKNHVYVHAVRELKKRGITVITHIILGLPNETREDMLSSAELAVSSGTDGIKLQLLHVLEGTDLCGDYNKGSFSVLSLDEYMDILFDCIEHLPENIVIHRITGDAPKAHLVAPTWSADKKTVLNTINREMKLRGVKQGRKARRL
ncbi:MAG: TIGR01212 family radical SAM protein [Ruminococcaceae bacterium]|nr:TIGR01212 family radical SAM protein [Oscillospiraceae bacterium]